MIFITNAEYMRDYQIKITFNNRSEFTVDLKNHISGGVFEALKNLTYFSNFTLHPDLETLVWENGADFAPEFLYEIGKSQSKQSA